MARQPMDLPLSACMLRGAHPDTPEPTCDRLLTNDLLEENAS